MRTVGIRIATAIVALVVGAVYGTAGTVSHAYAPAGYPVGLVLSIIGLGALLLGIRLLTDSRWNALAAAAGAVAATLFFSGTGPGGSVIVPNGPLAIAWTIAVPAIGAVAVVWPDRRRRPAPVDDGRVSEAAR